MFVNTTYMNMDVVTDDIIRRDILYLNDTHSCAIITLNVEESMSDLWCFCSHGSRQHAAQLMMSGRYFCTGSIKSAYNQLY